MAIDEALGVLEILDHDGQAVQRRQAVPLHDGLLGRLRGQAGAAEIAGGDGVHGVVDRLDAGDTAFQQFDGGEALPPDLAAGFEGWEVAGFGHAVLGGIAGWMPVRAKSLPL